MNTLLTYQDKLKINPPCWESALHFLDTFTYLDSEFGIVDLVATEMFDLSHPGTAEELNLPKAIRAIRHKSSLAKLIVQWIAENKDQLDDCPDDFLPAAFSQDSHRASEKPSVEMLSAEKLAESEPGAQ